VKSKESVCDLNLASTGGPSARTIVPYSPSRPHPKTDGLDGWELSMTLQNFVLGKFEGI